jgi:nicotinate-nucleotide--dimethylbenzimidazole phosphoribosyltransferase
VVTDSPAIASDPADLVPADPPGSGTPALDPNVPPPSTGRDRLKERSRQVRVPSRSAEYDARRRLTGLLLPPGHLGDHADLAVWWAGVHGACPAPVPGAPRLVVFAADHGIAVRGVSALPLGWTAAAAAWLAEPDGPLSRALPGAGPDAPAEIVDVDVAGPQGPRSRPFDREPALHRDDVDDALDRGLTLADRLGEEHDLLALSGIGVGATTTAAALVGSALALPVLQVVGRGSGIDDTAWMRKAAALRDGLRRTRLAGIGPGSPATDHLQHLGSMDAALAVGFLVGSAAARRPVILDGPIAAAAALLAQRAAPSARHWWLGVQPVTDPLSQRVWNEIGIATVATTAEGAGLGAALALTSVATAAAVLSSPTVDERLPDLAG